MTAEPPNPPDERLTAALMELGQLADAMGPALVPRETRDLLRAITRACKEIFGAAACSLAVLSADETELIFTTASGSGADVVTGFRIPVGQGVAGWVVMSGQSIAIDDLRGDPRFASDVAESTGYVPRAILAAPVAGPERVLGVIEVLDRDADRPSADRDLAVLALFADQAALALETTLAVADLGRVLLSALATASGPDLAAALDAAAARLPAPDRELARLAALFARLGRGSPGVRDMASRVVSVVMEYLEEPGHPDGRSSRRR